MSDERSKKGSRRERGDRYRGREYRIVEEAGTPRLMIDGEGVAIEQVDEKGEAWQSPRAYSWFPTVDELARNIILIEDILAGATADRPAQVGSR